MSQTEFQILYNKLNLEQKKAVDTIEGPVMVVAGPGTGKTSILTLRIANILSKTDTSADNILALTFTESGVHSMRRKLVQIMGAPAYRVKIFTFHGFCKNVIDTYPDYFENIIDSRPATEVDQINIIEGILKEGGYQHIALYGETSYYTKPSLSAIKSLKRENISPDELEKSVKEELKKIKNLPDLHHDKGAHKGKVKGEYLKRIKELEKSEELASVYEKYQSGMSLRKLFDYEDMIIKVIEALKKHQNLALVLQEEYQYVLADEHQDANNAQNTLLELLSSFHESPNLFIVGDEKQAIYRFQGASLENFLYFKRKFKDAVLINLSKNYRSHQTILDASHSLISKGEIEDKNLRIPLVSENDRNKKLIDFYQFQKPESELLFILSDLEERIENGEDPSDIAVLFRDNKDVLPFVSVLEKSSIPFLILSDENILSDDTIKGFLSLLRAVEGYGQDEYLSQSLFLEFLGITASDAFKIISTASRQRISIKKILKSKESLKELDLELEESVSKFILKMDKWASLSKNKNLLSVIDVIARESGFVEHIMRGENSVRMLEKWDSVVASIKRLIEAHREYKLTDYISYLDTLDLYGVRLDVKWRPAFKSGVYVMTTHKSKGLEFNTVYITGATDGHFGNRKKGYSFKLPVDSLNNTHLDENEDERRLFYVAMTRAKSHVVITMSKENEEGRERLPSQFIEEIDKELVSIQDTESIEKEILNNRHEVYVREPVQGLSLSNKEYLQKLFLDQGLSVTALNNYLECPWKYFFENLIRLPKPSPSYLYYGTAIHAGLKYFFDKYREGENPEKKVLVESFERALSRLPMPSDEFDNFVIRGKDSLSAYFDAYNGSWDRTIKNEFPITGIFLPLNKDTNFLIRGKLDKVEFLNDREVNVVDYKTGSQKSKNDILGKTKTSNGNIKRQLDFYKLLLDNSPETKYEMISGEIDFIEPDKSTGKLRRERFDITSEDMEKVKAETIETAQKIYELDFWSKSCEDKNCEYCNRANRFRTIEVPD